MRSWRSLAGRASQALRAGRAADAAALYRRAVAAAERSADPEELGVLLHNAGLAADHAGDGRAAVAALRRSVAVLESGPDGAEHLVDVLSRLGAVLVELGELDEGVQAHERALALASGSAQVAEVRMNLGIALKDASRLTEALVHLRGALEVARAERLAEVQAHCLTGLGLTEEKLQDPRAARGYYEQARPIYRELGDRRNEATVLYNLAVLAHRMQEYEAADRLYDEAFRADRGLQNARGVADHAAARAALAASRGDDAAAEAAYRRALRIYEKHGFTRRAVDALTGLAVVVRDVGRLGEADRLLDRAEQLARELADPHDLHDVHVHRGDVALLRGNRPAARAHYVEAAAAMAESRRRLLREDDALSYFDADRLESVDRLVRLAVETGDVRDCVEWIERAKGQEMVRQMAHIELPPPRSAPPAAVAREQAAVATVRQLVREMRAVETPDEQHLRGLRQARAELDGATAAVARYDPELVALRAGESSTWPDMAELPARLGGPDAVLVHYYVRDDGTGVVGVRSGAPPEMVLVDVPARHLRQLAANPAAGATDDPAVRALVAPLERWAPPGAHVLLCPHDALHRIPLHAVPVAGVALGERNVVAYAPSATVARHCLAKRPPPGSASGRFLALADASAGVPLPFARDHVRAVADKFTAAHLPVTVHEGTAATAAALAADLADGANLAVVHLAVHGYTDPASGLLSGLRLSDGSLTAHDVLGLSLHCRLVVLASCETALAERRPGDELLGLTRSLIYAGAPGVLATLWPVDQLATAILMDGLYAELLAGTGPAAALRVAAGRLRQTTVQAALDHLAYTRRRAADDPAIHTAVDLAAAQLALTARDPAAAAATLDELVRLVPTGRARREAERLRGLATLAARADLGSDYSRRPFADPRHWAAFVLIGAP